MDEPQSLASAGEALAPILARMPPHLRLVVPAGKPAGAELARRDALDAERDIPAMAEIYERQREFRRREWEQSLSRAARFRNASIGHLMQQQDPYGAVSGWLDSGTLTLLLHGPSHTGKTYDAYAVGNAAHEAGLWVTGWHLLDLLAELRPNDLEPDTARRIWGSVTSADVLILDDLGTESRSAWTIEQVMRLLDTRSRNDLRTVVTTNLGVPELKAYGERILYRLIVSATTVPLSGEVILPVVGSGPGFPDGRTAAGVPAGDIPPSPA